MYLLSDISERDASPSERVDLKRYSLYTLGFAVSFMVLKEDVHENEPLSVLMALCPGPYHRTAFIYPLTHLFKRYLLGISYVSGTMDSSRNKTDKTSGSWS